MTNRVMNIIFLLCAAAVGYFVFTGDVAAFVERVAEAGVWTLLALLFGVGVLVWYRSEGDVESELERLGHDFCLYAWGILLSLVFAWVTGRPVLEEIGSPRAKGAIIIVSLAYLAGAYVNTLRSAQEIRKVEPIDSLADAYRHPKRTVFLKSLSVGLVPGIVLTLAEFIYGG